MNEDTFRCRNHGGDATLPSNVIDIRSGSNPSQPAQQLPIDPATSQRDKMADSFFDLECTISNIDCMKDLCWKACVEPLAHSKHEGANTALFALSKLKEMIEALKSEYYEAYKTDI